MIAETIVFDILKGILPDKVFPLQAGQATTYPFIVYNRVSTIPNNTLCGDTGYSKARIQIDVKSDTYARCLELEVLVRKAFQFHDLSVFQGRQDLSDPENNTYWITMDYSIFEKGI